MPKVSSFSGTRFLTNPSPAGFGIRFSVADDKSIFVTAIFDESKEGGKDILHGGAIAAVLDEAMGTAASENGTAGYTVTMTYNYKAHIPLNEEIRIRAWVDRIEGRKVFTECDVMLPNDTIAVTGTGIFVQSETLQKQLAEHPYIPPEDEI